MNSLHKLEKAYQIALKAKEKLKCSRFRKNDGLKATKEKGKNVVAPPISDRPNPPSGGGTKGKGKGASSSYKCFRCG